MNPPDLSCIACGIDSPCTFHESNPAGTPAPVDDPTGGALGYDPVGHARESLARDFDLRPTNRVRVREAKAEPVRERSVARDMGLADDELTPVAQLRLRDRWDRLDREPATPAGAVTSSARLASWPSWREVSADEHDHDTLRDQARPCGGDGPCRRVPG
jgi:hypothetical protein